MREGDAVEFKGLQCVSLSGFSLHAARRVEWSDGTRGIKLSPSALIEKLIALIPPKRSPLVRYSGVFAPNFKRRDEIVLRAGKRKRKVSIKQAVAEKSQRRRVSAGSWARLLKRVFAIDVSRCPRVKWHFILKPRPKRFQSLDVSFRICYV